jgi:hypothetical protein
MEAVKCHRLDTSMTARRNPLISSGQQGSKKPMQLARFVRTVWFPQALVVIGFTGGCGSGAPPATGPSTGVVVNGVPQVDDTFGKGKRYMYDPKGAARAEKAKAKAGAVGPDKGAQGGPR